MSSLNREIIIQIMNQIKAEPALFNMRKWCRTTERMRRDAYHSDTVRLRELDERNICGTTFCIAGYAVVLSQGMSEDKFAWDSAKWMQTGANAIGITEIQARKLFWLSGWPKQFKERFWATDYGLTSTRDEAQAAIDLLQAVLDTDGKVLDDMNSPVI